jgi:hypothetical protein
MHEPLVKDFQILKALIAGYHLRVAKRESSKKRTWYVTVRHGASAKMTAGTNLGNASRSNERIMYNEFYSDGISKHTIRLVSAIVPEFFISARPDYWYDTEFLSKGQIRDKMVDIIAGMTGNTADFIRGDMPENPAQP